MASLTFQSKRDSVTIRTDKDKGLWLADILQQLSVSNYKILTRREVMYSYEAAGLVDFELFWDNKPVNTLHKFGLLNL
jgi:hypothetical protein